MGPETTPPHADRLFATQRTDNWWGYPLTLFVILSGFVVYGFVRVFTSPTIGSFVADDPVAGFHYLAPFGTPDLTVFVPGAWKDAIPLLAYPGFLILPFPAGFRFTCYYYRKAYYRAFVARPSACNVEAAKGVKYKGERGLLVFQNLHRYFLLAALVITGFLLYDAVRSVWTPHGLYFGIGSALMLLNIVLLAGYTFGCHSLRHLVGGRLDCFSCTAIARTRHSMWEGVTRLNQNHGRWAMASLFSVALTDAYIWWLTAHPGTTEILGVPV